MINEHQKDLTKKNIKEWESINWEIENSVKLQVNEISTPIVYYFHLYELTSRVILLLFQSMRVPLQCTYVSLFIHPIIANKVLKYSVSRLFLFRKQILMLVSKTLNIQFLSKEITFFQLKNIYLRSLVIFYLTQYK